MKTKIPSFDDAMDAFENGGDKADKRDEAKLAKFTQLSAGHTALTIKIQKQNIRLKKSFYDPSIDSVQVYLDLNALNAELEAYTDLKNALFPNGVDSIVTPAV